jgi:2-polyprenyl-6-methoxyphenol hydroxylase-like FAD-dependent oxidoreductase
MAATIAGRGGDSGPADRYDVIIVGGGPVGQVLAVLLGRRGWRIGLLDKQPVPYRLPRAVHFDGEVARLLQAVGVTDEEGAWTQPLDAYEWRNAAGEVLLRLQAEGVAPTCGWPVSTMFSQPELERRLAEQLTTVPTVEVHRGWEVTAVAQDDAAVTVTARAGDGRTRTVVGPWLVGCDGAASFVRDAAGITTEDLGYFFDWLIVDVIPDEPGSWEPLNIQVCDPRRPTTAVSGGPGRRRWEFMALPGETRSDLADEATAWRLIEPWGMTPGTARIERHAVYTFAARIATQWRQGRVLLAGDAAHQMPPFAGQGFCSGVRDAANLEWKLDLVLSGRAPAGLLDSYATERAPNARTMIDLSIDLGRIICVPDEAEAAARDTAMVAAARESGPVPLPPPPPIGPGALVAGDPHAGQAWIQGRVTSDGRTGRFDDVVGRGWVLLGADADSTVGLSDDAAAWWAALGGRTVHVGPGRSTVDVDGTYREWLARHGIAAVLVRPDFIVFATTAQPDGVDDLVRSLRAALGATR